MTIAGAVAAALATPGWATAPGNVNGSADPYIGQLEECFRLEDDVLDLLAQLPEDVPVPAGSSAAVGGALATARECLAELSEDTSPGMVPPDVFLPLSETRFFKSLKKAIRDDQAALDKFVDGKKVESIRRSVELARTNKYAAKLHLQGINVGARKHPETVPPDRYDVPGEIPFANAYHASAGAGRNPVRTFAWVIEESDNAKVAGKTVRLMNDQPVARGGDERVAIWNFRAQKANDPPGVFVFQYDRTLEPPFDLATTMGGYTCPTLEICDQNDGTRVCYSYTRVDVVNEFYTVCAVPRDLPPRVQVFDFTGITGGGTTLHNNVLVPNALVVDLFTRFNGTAFVTEVQPRDTPGSRIIFNAAKVPTSTWTHARVGIGAAGLTGKFQVGAEALTLFTRAHP